MDIVIILAAIVLTLIAYAGFLWRVFRLIEDVDEQVKSVHRVNVDYKSRIETLETEFKRFSDPEVIAEDMTQVADLIENRQAGRATMPRPGSEHARISQIRDPRATDGWDQKTKHI